MPSLIASGTDNPHYDQVLVEEIPAASRNKAIIILGGDHSLDIAADVVGSDHAAGQVVGELTHFVTVAWPIPEYG